MLSSYKRLGDYIRLVDERNRNLEVETLLGLSMTKQFRKSTSNVVGTDMSKYKIVRKDRFACDFMSVIRVFKLPVVLQTSDDPILVSPAYAVFEVIDENILLPEYLMMWFRRDEFDRYCFFKCDSAVRGGFNWEELCDTQLPVPSIEKQKEIIAEYEAVEQRIRLNNTLCEKLEETAQTLYRHWFEDFEFPYSRHCEERGTSDEAISLNALPKVAESSAVYKRNNSPDTNAGYKSSGGEMVYSEELGKEIPKGWKVGSLLDIASYKNGLAMQNFEPEPNEEFLPVIKIRELGLGTTDENSNVCTLKIPEDVKIYDEDIIFSWSGSLKVDIWVGGRAGLNQHLFKVTSKKFPKWFYYLWTKHHLDEFIRIADGNKTSLGHIKREHLENAIVLIPTQDKMEQMNFVQNSLMKKNIILKKQNQKLEELKSLLLGKMAVENIN